MMQLRMGLLRKRRSDATETFLTHWRERHGPLAVRLPGLECYWQNAVMEKLQRGIEFPRGPWDFDGFSQLWFNASHDPARLTLGALSDELVIDEQRFLETLSIVTVEQTTVIEPAPSDRPRLLKRISTLRRRSDLSSQDFLREWQVHAEWVRRMPGVCGYRQNVVLERQLEKGTVCDYADLPIDGIVEMWFHNEAELGSAFGSPDGQRTMAHAREFLAEITAFVVEEHRVL